MPSEEKAEKQEDTRISISLPTNSYFMSGIRDFTLALIKNTTQFSEKWAFRFQSVVDELCNNAIEHGSKKGDHITITFLHHPEDSVEIIVEDNGTGEKPLKAKEIESLILERQKPSYTFSGIRGRGLTKIVSEWTDELAFEDRAEGGLRITVRKYLKDVRQNAEGLKAENAVSTDPTHIVLTE